MSNQTENTRAAVRALLRSLHFSGVKFLRFVSLDTSGNVRAKVRPIDSLLSQQSPSLSDQVSIAAICFAGLPYYADVMIPGTGLDAKDVCKIEPDLNSLRILPYAPKTAMVMGYILNQYNNESSEYCCKAVLQRVIQEAAEKCNIAFVSY
jgi:glutamine synthetase